MTVLVVIGLALLGCFAFVLLFGPPYLPTLSKQVQIALDMSGLRAGETLLELGCGDGKVLVAAAQRGYRAVGYELNPLLVLVCLVRTWRYRKQVRVIWGNFLIQRWPKHDAIFVFGLQRIMPQLDKKIMQSISTSVNVVSFVFTFPGRKPLAENAALQLYRFKPAAHLKQASH